MFYYQTVDGAVSEFSIRTMIEEVEFVTEQRGFKWLCCISVFLLGSFINAVRCTESVLGFKCIVCCNWP